MGSTMKFALGYPVVPRGAEPFCELVRDYRESVAEIYFAWPGDASGRTASRGGRKEIKALLADLADCRAMGLKLDLLLNAACYGHEAMSVALGNRVARTLDAIGETLGPVDVVTTTSPAIARAVRAVAPGTDVRASVNMRIGEPEAMSYLADLFDSFYVQRDYNRDLGRLSRLRGWADKAGKRLCMLANSGCLRLCPGQSFHDNLVAHAGDAARQPTLDDFEPLVCRRVLRDQDRLEALLQATWVRPEDLHRIEPFFDVVKLATRTHDRPRLVLDAYARGKYHGNLLDLLEPGYGPLLAPTIFDNGRLPRRLVRPHQPLPPPLRRLPLLPVRPHPRRRPYGRVTTAGRPDVARNHRSGYDPCSGQHGRKPMARQPIAWGSVLFGVWWIGITLFGIAVLIWVAMFAVLIVKGMFSVSFDWTAFRHLHLPFLAAIVGLTVPIVCLRKLRCSRARRWVPVFTAYVVVMLAWGIADIRCGNWQISGMRADGNGGCLHSYFTWYFLPQGWIGSCSGGSLEAAQGRTEGPQGQAELPRP